MSMSRRCDIWKATDGKWYMVLGMKEYAYDSEDCVVYGPFSSEEKVMSKLDQYSNPGAMDFDDSGTVRPPDREKDHYWNFEQDKMIAELDNKKRTK